MSGYRGRTGPNFSHYLSNLNTIPSPYDGDQFQADDLSLDENLALFTNADFTHLDIPPLPENGPVDFDLEEDKAVLPNDAEDLKYEDLLAGTESSPTLGALPAEFAAAAEPGPIFADYTSSVQPPQSNNIFSESAAHPSPLESSSTSSPQDNSSQSAALKNNNNLTRPTQILAEEQSRLAAEEDKRRRNTAASARFRVKKKQREQALEKTVKEISDKNALLEAKITQLETENKWLKNLITEKNGNQSKEEIATAYQKYRRESEERETAKEAEQKGGLGTRQ